MIAAFQALATLDCTGEPSHHRTMTIHLCTACGTSFPPGEKEPARCPICDDPRQFVPKTGQDFTTDQTLRTRHRAVIAYDGPFLGIGATPAFAIGQRALLVRTRSGNVLWDLVPFLDEALVTIIEALGGLRAIAISHPHFYGNIRRWAEAFGDVPVYIHGDDAHWAMDPPASLSPWQGERCEIGPGLTLVRCGGHFAGGTVMHADKSATGLSVDALLTGDILQVTPGGSGVSVMRSYPNLVPLGPASVQRVAAALNGFDFDVVAGAFWGRVIEQGGREAVDRSLENYLRAIEDDKQAGRS